MDECDWTRCAAPARLDVLLGQSFVGAEHIGSFCVPHASLCSIDAQDRVGVPAWYDWHRPSLQPELAGAVGETAARVIPLFRNGNGHRGQLPSAQTWAGTDVADP